MESFLVQNAAGVTNTKIVCRDGVIRSHKILMASNSRFIKNIMRDITCNDDITIILPDHDKSEVNKILFDEISGCKLIETFDSICDLSTEAKSELLEIKMVRNI